MKRFSRALYHELPTGPLVLPAGALVEVRGGSAAPAALPGTIKPPGVIADPFYHGG
jgi:hypothetical protein